MSDCCGDSQAPQKKACPSCQSQGLTVPFATVLHHLKQSWQTKFKQQTWYFCEGSGCAAVYFGGDNSLIKQSDLRTQIGLKTPTDDGFICYCYGVTKSQAKDLAIKQFVMNQTKQKNCACTTRNPSSRCCLKHFPKIL